MEGLDSGLEGEDIQKGCLLYVMNCRSLSALESLWNAYTSGRLDEMAKQTMICRLLLREIGAHWLSLEAEIEYDEYLLCKKELQEMGKLY